MVEWLKALVVLVFLGWILYAAWDALPYLLVLLGAVALYGLARRSWNRWRAPRRFRAVYGREGRDLLLVPAKGGRVRIVRFFQAFRDHHHGKDAPLREREAELEACLAEKLTRAGLR